MKHECVSVDKFSGNDISKKFQFEKWKDYAIKMFQLILKAIHVFIELYITASLPYDFVQKDFTLSIPF